jgi:peptide/nickel transport system ATP-binding protein
VASNGAALSFEGVDVAYSMRGRERSVLRGLTLSIGRGEAYGLVGESGCGKSTAALAAVRYLPRNGRVVKGRILVAGQDLAKIDEAGIRSLRRGGVAMVYQDPGRALNPSIKIGPQIEEIFEFDGESKTRWRDRSKQMLAKVRISDPERVMQRYPHQLSGGMQQRVCIAMALARNPALLILDEPTTGLDVTVEAEVLDLVQQLRDEFKTSILFISHNLAIVARMCERVGVLYAGRLVEEGPTSQVFSEPAHPYSVGLLRSLPRGGKRKADGPLDTIPGLPPSPGAAAGGCVFAARCQLADQICRDQEPDAADLGGRFSRCHYHERARESHVALSAEVSRTPEPKPIGETILSVKGLSKTFRAAGLSLKALCDVSIELRAGETLGLVGESGSGKTTFARALLGLVAADGASEILLDGQRLEPNLRDRTMGQVKALQIVFQNPDSALNRSHAIRRLIGRAVRRLAGAPPQGIAERVRALARAVLLPERHLSARPRQLSGGLKQRVAIARAFAGEPRVIVCDEPTSALDVSVQAAILNLLADLQASMQVSYLFISHDLGVVRYLSDRIAVLYLGRLMQIGSAERVFAGPHHPYTEALLSAVPDISGRQRPRIHLTGEIPSAVNPPSGCVFHTRCPRKISGLCEAQEPPYFESATGDGIRCHIPPVELALLQSGRENTAPA